MIQICKGDNRSATLNSYGIFISFPASPSRTFMPLRSSSGHVERVGSYLSLRNDGPLEVVPASLRSQTGVPVNGYRRSRHHRHLLRVAVRLCAGMRTAVRANHADRIFAGWRGHRADRHLSHLRARSSRTLLTPEALS